MTRYISLQRTHSIVRISSQNSMFQTMSFNNLLLFLSVYVLYLLPQVAQSQIQTLSSDKTQHKITNDKLTVFCDSTNLLTINDILKIDSSLFSRNNKTYPVIENGKYTYWVKIKLINKSENTRWVLENADSHIQEFSFYFVDKNLKISTAKAGNSWPFNLKEYDHKNFIFDLPIAYNDQATVYLKARSNYKNPLIINIKSFSSFSSYAFSEYLILGLFYGILLVMLVYNIILYFSIYERIYLYYSLYVLASILLTLSEDGLGFQYLWPSLPGLNQFATNYSPLLLLLTFTIYAKKFLHTREKTTLLDNLINVVTGVYLVYFLAKVFVNTIPWNPSFFIVPFLLIYAAAIVSYKKGNYVAKYFIIAYTFIIFSLLLLIARLTGILHQSNVFTVYSFNIGLVIEVVLFSYSLSERMKFLKLDKEKADQKIIQQLKENEVLKDRVNKELEMKVSERTKELAEANVVLNQQKEELETANDQLNIQAEELEAVNEQLLMQAEEINRINELLSKENVALKTNVEELEEARIMLKEVNFEEFSKVFPDNESCFKFLTDFKWADTYACRKCGNKRHVALSPGDEHSRRCTKCRYKESATAYTIFHKCKFPITKAFYMLFLIYASKNKITSQQLSELLQLRLSTCWQFNKKIKEAMDNKKKAKGDHHKQDGWTVLIPYEQEGD